MRKYTKKMNHKKTSASIMRNHTNKSDPLEMDIHLIFIKIKNLQTLLENQSTPKIIIYIVHRGESFLRP